MMNEISIEVDGNTIAGSYEVNRGMIMVSGGKLGSKSAPLGGPATTELLARRLLRELYVESAASNNLNIHTLSMRFAVIADYAPPYQRCGGR